MNEKKFCKGEKVYKEGDRLDAVYFVKKGEFGITYTVPT